MPRASSRRAMTRGTPASRAIRSVESPGRASGSPATRSAVTFEIASISSGCAPRWDKWSPPDSLVRLLLVPAHRPELAIPPLAALFAGQVGRVLQVALDRFRDRRGRALRVRVRPSRRLRNDLVDDAELLQVPGGQAESLGRLLLSGSVLPENGGAAFRRDDRIDRVLEHQDPDSQPERGRPRNRAPPATPAGSSANVRSPCSSTKSVVSAPM